MNDMDYGSNSQLAIRHMTRFHHSDASTFSKLLITLHWGFALMDSCVATIIFSVSLMPQQRL